MKITVEGKRRAESSEFGYWLRGIVQMYEARDVPWKLRDAVINTMIAWVLSGHSVKALPAHGEPCPELARFMQQNADAINTIAVNQV